MREGRKIRQKDGEMRLGRNKFSGVLLGGLGLLLSACASHNGLEPVSHFGRPTDLSCVPYAREVSGIDLHGDACDWWSEAAGDYPRTHRPHVGAVLVFKSHGPMYMGHVAVVTNIESRREILVTQANWLPGRIEDDVPVEDVSRRNNWSRVRVWYAPAHEMGITTYPTYGFILPN